VRASINSDGAVGDMRERYNAVAVEIAESLDVLAKSAARAPPKARAAALKAIRQIAAVQEKLSHETLRLPDSYGERFTVMHSVLQAQQGALVQLALIVKQLQSPSGGRGKGDAQLAGQHPRQQQAMARLSKSELSRAVLVSRRTHPEDDQRFFSDRGDFESGGRIPARLQAKRERKTRSAHGLRRSRTPVVLRAVASRSLILVLIIAGGLVVAYSRFPQASDQAGLITKRLEVLERNSAASVASPVQATANPDRAAQTGPKQVTREAMRERSAAGAPYPIVPGVSGDGPPPSALAQLAYRSGPTSSQIEASGDRNGPRAASAGEGPAVVSNAGFVPVLFTHKDRATVNRALVDLRHRFAAVLMYRQSEVQDLDMGEKGIWHRLVVLPPGPQEQAEAVCQKLQAGGYDRCWVKSY
jgi:hypothetical protein